MEKSKDRGLFDRSQLHYRSDLAGEEWVLVAPLIPVGHL
jgi:hypothetical protein